MRKYLFKILQDYVVNLLRCLPNIRVADRNYLHTVITVDNTQVMGESFGCVQTEDWKYVLCVLSS